MLEVVDFVVMGVFLVVCLGIGLYFSLSGDRQENTNDYFFGGKKLKILPVSISTFLSFASAILILGTAAEVYDHGIVFWLFMMGEWMMIPISAFIIMPVFYDTGAPTVTKYLGLRFNSPTLRKLTSIILMLRMLTYMSLCFLAPSIAFRTGTNYPIWAIILISAAVATIYTAIGGIKAVVWTDTLQGVVLVAGLITILVKATIDAGGWVNMFQVGAREKRVYFPSPNPDPTVRASSWAFSFGVMFALMPQLGFSQETIQRIMSLPSKQAARTSLLLMYPISLVINSLCVCVGIAVFAFYAGRKECDPVESGVVDNSNQVLPYYVFTELKSFYGFGGLFLASLSSGALSSVSSGLNCIAVMIWEDFVGPRYQARLTQKQATTISKVIVCILGAVGAGISIALSYMSGTILEVCDGVLGCFSGPITGIFFLAFFFPMANAKGAMVGAAVGFAVDLWLVLGRLINKYQWESLPPFTTAGCDVTNSTLVVNTTIPAAFSSMYTRASYPNTTADPSYSLMSSSATGERSHQPEGWERVYMIHFFYYALVGAVVTVVVGLLVSCCTGRTKTCDVNPVHLSPVVRWLIKRRKKSVTMNCDLTRNRRQGSKDILDKVESHAEKVRLTEFNQHSPRA